VDRVARPGARDPADAAAALAARHMTALSLRVDEDEIAFFLTDGEVAVEVSHAIGDPEEAAKAFDELAAAAAAHAERIRARARGDAGWT
jgi:hypothetical protein